VVVAVAHGLGVLRGIAEVPGHQAELTAVQVEADLTLVGRLAGDRVDQDDLVAGQRAAHRPQADVLAGGVADLRGRFRLPVAVADRDAPRPADLLDHLGVERLAGRHALAQRAGPARGQISLDQHPPDGWRRAERRDAAVAERLEQSLGVEPGLVEDEDRGRGVPRGEEVRPGVLGPAG
jgi:hypothetical protein